MDPASQEAKFLSTAVGLRQRDDLLLVHVSGDDRRDWLNGQLTNDIRTATPGQAVYALAVTVRGKIMADVWVLDRGERLAVLLPRAAHAAVLESFERQIIMEDVILEPAPDVRLLSAQGPRAAELTPAGVERHQCDELGQGGWIAPFPDDATLAAHWPQLVTAAEQLGGGRVGEAGFELARLRAGRPRFAADFWDQHYPQEAGLLTRAVSFNKGCYLGQEVVCTLENRGRTSRRLVSLQSPAQPQLERGTPLQDASGQEIGQLTSICRDAEHDSTLALAYLKTAAAVPGTRVNSSAIPLEIRALVGDA